MLTVEQTAQIISEITASDEVTRRTLAKRRHDIYRDGGKNFLIEQIRREFSEDAVKEMRLAPVNLLKKIVNKRSGVYKRAPLRLAEDPKDQDLVKFYEDKLKLNTLMQKANRYYTLQSNCGIYCRPMGNKLVSSVITPYLYSIIANSYERSEIDGYVLNNFVESGLATPSNNLPSATGVQGYSQDPGFGGGKQDKVASNEKQNEMECRRYVFWTDHEHFTTDYKGDRLLFEGMDPEDPQLFVNPIGKKPIVNLAKERDAEVWASQGEDMIDLTIALQLGWSDLLTIAKHQGFGTLTVISEEEPKKLVVGVNRAIWLKATPNAPTPSISYVQANSPLTEYKELLMELLGLLLTTNDMEPNSISGKASTTNYTSGFHALIAMSDNLEAIELDKPAMLEAEKEHFDIIARWHNLMFDFNMLEDDARALGKFSDEFKLTVQFADIKPLESEDEKLSRIKQKIDMKLTTRKEALKVLNPDLSDKQIDDKLKMIDEELSTLRNAMASPSPEPGQTPPQENPPEQDEDLTEDEIPPGLKPKEDGGAQEKPDTEEEDQT